MFGRSRPVIFDPYGSRRRARTRVPRWLVLLLLGVALGVGGVLLLQERYLPPRLSAQASTELRDAYERSAAEAQRLKTELAQATAKLEAARSDSQRLGNELASTRSGAEHAQADLASLIGSLPPDPRGGTVAIRSARFGMKGAQLGYDIVLTRERATGKPLAGVIQLAVAGQTARGTETTVSVEPVAVTIGGHEVVRGNATLPDGFKPRQTTIQVLDRPGGKSLGMRVMLN